MADSVTAETVLAELGFTETDQARRALQDEANDPTSGAGNLSDSGPYRVLQAWTHEESGVLVHVEQNTSPDTHDAAEDEPVALVTHPKVFVVQSSKGLVSVSPRTPEGLRAAIEALT